MQIRTITSGITLKEINELAIKEAASFNKKAKVYFKDHGFVVQETRIATNSWCDYLKGDVSEVVSKAQEIERICKDNSVCFFSLGDANSPGKIKFIPDIIKNTSLLFCCANIADNKKGIDYSNIRAAAKVIKRISEETEEGYGNLMFCAMANCGPDIPFFPASYHKDKTSFAVGLENSDLVMKAFCCSSSIKDASENLKIVFEEEVKRVEEVAIKLSVLSPDVEYRGIDVSVAPSLKEEESLAFAYEKLGYGQFGGPGTLAISALITGVLKNLNIRTCGYSGLMLPVLEDFGLAQRANDEMYNLDNLLLYSSVCGCGLDTVPVPGDISEKKLEMILLDVASLSLKLNKPLSARLFPIPGKKAGEMTAFNSPFLVNCKILKV